MISLCDFRDVVVCNWESNRNEVIHAAADLFRVEIYKLLARYLALIPLIKIGSTDGVSEMYEYKYQRSTAYRTRIMTVGGSYQMHLFRYMYCSTGSVLIAK